jgi:hypothetical protein
MLANLGGGFHCAQRWMVDTDISLIAGTDP